ncbi:MAG: DUF4251 domain-containing protein [Mariniphaga sp.]|nr:DUF4251 domain-containing protein [Mariniphaga sp.]
MKNLLILLLVFSVSLPLIAQEKSRKERKAEREAQKAEKVSKLLDSKEFVFNATHALPMGGGSIYLTSSFDLKISGDSVYAYLPFYGVAYQAEYGGRNGGFEFQEPIKEYSVESIKSRKQIIFKVKTQKDTYNMVLSVSNSGNADLHVNSVKRQSIRFNGTVDAISE